MVAADRVAHGLRAVRDRRARRPAERRERHPHRLPAPDPRGEPRGPDGPLRRRAPADPRRRAGPRRGGDGRPGRAARRGRRLPPAALRHRRPVLLRVHPARRRSDLHRGRQPGLRRRPDRGLHDDGALLRDDLRRRRLEPRAAGHGHPRAPRRPDALVPDVHAAPRRARPRHRRRRPGAAVPAPEPERRGLRPGDGRVDHGVALRGDAARNLEPRLHARLRAARAAVGPRSVRPRDARRRRRADPARPRDRELARAPRRPRRGPALRRGELRRVVPPAPDPRRRRRVGLLEREPVRRRRADGDVAQLARRRVRPAGGGVAAADRPRHRPPPPRHRAASPTGASWWSRGTARTPT